ncbi:hypothetical protein [Enterobacter sp. JBIWA005]|uniref:hypothetical protein n=1 Tax=Enterobacter sp. JBIWA005 TaxID=2831891 RepID=UPI001CBA7D53|nr:hypothetical protein [Enterobacter sp. JBIWA005]UAN30791.1 hypothetical protein KGP22_16385 [Enterobacter sp. JBIWA005]
MNQKEWKKMNEHHKKQIEVIREIEAQGFTTQEAATFLVAGELSRLNEIMDYLKRWGFSLWRDS